MVAFASQPPLDADPASELLLGMRLVGVKYRRIEAARPFGLDFGELPDRAQFHFVGRGPVWLRSPGGRLFELHTGDAVLLPQGGEHQILSAPDVAPCGDLSGFESVSLCPTVSSCAPKDAGKDDDALLFSACMEFDLGGMQMLVGSMPEVMLVGTLLD
ncbi:hypothetical protein KCV01_g26408, partial [Aureobasidium melanogenum]